MAHSLELRSPLLDHEVLELGVSLPDSLKVEGRRGKVALRRAFADALPPEVAERGKTGFGVPISRLVPRRAARARRRRAARRARARARPAAARGGGAAAGRPCGRPRRPRPPALVPADARALAADARRRRRPSPAAVSAVMTRVRLAPRSSLVAVVPRLAVLLYERGDILDRVHGEERRLRADVRRLGHVRVHPRRAVRVDAAALRVLPDPDLLDLRAVVVGGRARSRSRVAVATALLVYEIGRRFVSRRAGLVAAVSRR